MIKPDGVEQFSFYLSMAHVYKTYMGIGTPILNPQGSEIMIYEGKKSTDKWYPVRLLDAGDSTFPRTGVVVGSVTVTYGFESAVAETPYAIIAADWKEQGNGNYWLNMGAGEFTQQGKYTVKVRAYPIANDWIFYVEVRDFMTTETIADVPVSHQGTAQAGAASNIQLAATASAIDDFYVGNIVSIVSGAGAGQARLITLYDGGTQWALVYPAWALGAVPNNTSVYKILPLGPSMIEGMEPALQAAMLISIENTVHDADLSTHLVGNTLGRILSGLARSEFEDSEFFAAVGAVPAQGITPGMAASGVIQYEHVRISFTGNYAAPDFEYYLLWGYNALGIVAEVRSRPNTIW
jgi:hypothetical protein